MQVELRPHQEEVLEKMHNGCVLWGGVGTGKTITALAYAMRREPGKKIVVITTAKKRDTLDWEKEAAKMAFPVEDILVDSWNKIQSYVDVEDHLFIFDEQRLVGTGAWTKSFQKIARKNRWILLSATPGDTWSDYAPLFIANGWYKNITEFRRTHAVYSRYTTYPKIERYINEGRLQRYRKQILVEMPMERHTTRHINYVDCDYDHDLLEIVKKRRWNIYDNKPLRNAGELYGVMRKVVSTDPDRAEKLEELIEEHPRLIVFYNYDYELEILREICQKIEKNSNELYRGTTDHTDSSQSGESATGLRENFESSFGKPTTKLYVSKTDENSRSLEKTSQSFEWAEWNGHRHQPVPSSDRWVYLVQYMSGSEGWNCIDTDSMAFWSLTYSWKQFHQAQGRIDRMNTPFKDLHYYVLMTDSLAEKPVIKSLNKKENFQPK